MAFCYDNNVYGHSKQALTFASCRCRKDRQVSPQYDTLNVEEINEPLADTPNAKEIDEPRLLYIVLTSSQPSIRSESIVRESRRFTNRRRTSEGMLAHELETVYSVGREESFQWSAMAEMDCNRNVNVHPKILNLD